MTDKTGTDTDDEEEQNRELIAWLRTTLVALVARARAAVEQSVEEIAPQLRGTLERLHIPAGAVKPLALAAVLVVAAVAMPAAPFAGDATNNSTEEPVSGTTYDPVDGNDLRDVVSNSLGAATSSAPPAPSDVRTSAGSQTMSVQTEVVDGDPAIVLEDDRTHDGRWVAIETAWFQEHVGEVPQVARVKHESNGTYSTPIEARGEQAAFYVEEFSTNTVTFDGVLSVSGGPAVDGDTISYEAPNGGDDLSIDLTGVENSETVSQSATLSDGESLPIDVSGTETPQNSELTLSPAEQTSSDSVALGTVTDGASESVSVGGNQPARDASVTFTGSAQTDTRTISGSSGGSKSVNIFGNQEPTDTGGSGDPQVDVELYDASSYSNTFFGPYTVGSGNPEGYYYLKGAKQIYKDGGVDDATIEIRKNGNVIASNTDYYLGRLDHIRVSTTVFLEEGDAVSVTSSSDHKDVSGGDFDEVTGKAPSGDTTISTDTGRSVTITGSGSTGIDLTGGETSLDLTTSGDRAKVKSWSLEYQNTLITENPSVTVGGESASYTGLLGDGESVTKSIDLSTGSQSADVSTGGEVGVDLSWTEVTQTEDPSVTVGGTTISHSGVLADGETITEPIDLSAGSQSADVSSTGPVNVAASWTEASVTQDPIVEYNGQTASYDGTLGEGETASLTVNDSWINEGTNDLAVSLPTVSDGPVQQVEVDVTHDIRESRTIDYSAEAFSEQYTTSKTWTENTSNATLSIPWASSSVVSVRDVSVTYEDSTGATPSPRPNPTHRLESGSVVVDLGDVKAGWTTTVSATGSKVQVDGADLEVLNATAAGEDLDTRVRLNSPSDDVYLRVDETEQGQQLHYLANASWSNDEASQISADGTNEIRIPNAPDNGEAQLRTLPLAFDVETGAIDVDIPDGRLNEEEPVYRVSSGGSTGDSYHVTFTEAKDGQPYVLWSETREIVLDEGLASSPLTLSAEDSEETQVIQFREDDGSVTSSGGGVGGAIAGAAPMVTTSSPFSGLGGFLPGPGVLVVGLAGLVGLTFVARQTRLFDEGTASDAVANSAASVGERAGGLLGRALSNELVLAGLTLAGGLWLLTSGAFTETERLIISLGSVPVAMFLILQQFDQFNFRVWVGSTLVVAFLGVQALAPEVLETLAAEAGIVIVVIAGYLAYQAISAWRAEASTPETVNRLSISTEDDDDS